MSQPSFGELGGEDPFAILGLARGANDDEVRKARRRLLRQLHPDLPGGDLHKTQMVTAASDILLDPVRRRRYLEMVAADTVLFAMPREPAAGADPDVSNATNARSWPFAGVPLQRPGSRAVFRSRSRAGAPGSPGARRAEASDPSGTRAKSPSLWDAPAESAAPRGSSAAPTSARRSRATPAAPRGSHAAPADRHAWRARLQPRVWWDRLVAAPRDTAFIEVGLVLGALVLVGLLVVLMV